MYKLMDRNTGRGKNELDGLQLITGASANRVIFRTNRGKPKAVGVEYIKNGIVRYVSVGREVRVLFLARCR